MPIPKTKAAASVSSSAFDRVPQRKATLRMVGHGIDISKLRTSTRLHESSARGHMRSLRLLSRSHGQHHLLERSRCRAEPF